MIFCDRVIILGGRPLRENDKIVSAYSRSHGRLEIIFKSVKRPKSKLKSMSETLVLADLRIYHKHEGRLPICVGGETLSVFPGMRKDGERIFYAFHFCEIFRKLTPLNQPSGAKFSLLLSALEYLDRRPPFALLKTAFMLRFMELSGYGFEKTAVGIDKKKWGALHGRDWEKTAGVSLSASEISTVDSLVSGFLSQHLRAPLETSKFIP